MSSSSSSGSLALHSNQMEKEDPSSSARLNFSQHSTLPNLVGSNVDTIDSLNIRTIKQTLYKYNKTNISQKESKNPNKLETIEQSGVKNKVVTDQMNQALDVFFMFEEATDSEVGECNELETERAIIREMCNVVIKKLDSNKD